MPNIIDFKTKLNGGVRPNLYQVDIDFPARAFGAIDGSSRKSLMEETRFLCRSTSLPTHSQGLIEVPFRGRFLKIPGDRTFEAWTATFYNTSDFKLRAAFENWINIANQTDENIGVVGGLDALFTDITVRQLSKDSGGGKNSVLRTYRLVDAWPTSVGAINVAYDSNDALEEFDVEFQYQYLDADAPPSMLGNKAGLAGSGATGSVPPTGTDVGEPTYLSQEVN